MLTTDEVLALEGIAAAGQSLKDAVAAREVRRILAKPQWADVDQREREAFDLLADAFELRSMALSFVSTGEADDVPDEKVRLGIEVTTDYIHKMWSVMERYVQDNPSQSGATS